MSLFTRTKETWKNRLGPLWWYTAVFFCVQRFGDLINVYIGVLLVPHWIQGDQLGALLPLTQIGGLLGLPLAIMLLPFLKFLNVFAARGEVGKVKALMLDIFVLMAVSAVVVAAYTYWACPFVFERLRVNSPGLTWLLCGLALVGALTPVLSNALQSLQRFRTIAVSSALPPPIRLVVLLLLLPLIGLSGFFAAQLLVAVLGIGIALWGLRDVLSPAVKRESYRAHFREILQFTGPVAILTVAGTLQTTCESVVIRHFLPNVDSAAYYMMSRFADISCVSWGALILVFFPMVSARHEQGRDSTRYLEHSILFLLASGGVIALVLSLGGRWLLGLTATWRVYRTYAWLLNLLVVRCIVLQAAYCFTTYETACRRFSFAWYLTPICLLEAVMLYALGGIGFFQPYLPDRWWRWISALPTGHLNTVVGIMFAQTVVFAACVALQMGLRSWRRASASHATTVPVAQGRDKHG